LIAGVVDTNHQLIAGVDTGIKNKISLQVIACVNKTSDKLTTGVNDADVKLMIGVNNTGDKTAYSNISIVE